jgi:hypothetical protein
MVLKERIFRIKCEFLEKLFKCVTNLKTKCH